MASTTINDSYSIGTGEQEIKLKVTIKKAQISKSTVRINRQLIGEFEDSFEVTLGKAKDLVAATLFVDTTETDVDPDSDTTSFVLELSGGPAPYINQRSQTVSPGGFVVYNAEIVFIP